jgi:hypothetical protein
MTRIVRHGNYWVDAIRISDLRDTIIACDHPAIDIVLPLSDALLIVVLHPQIDQPRASAIRALAEVEPRLPLEIALRGHFQPDGYASHVRCLHHLGEALVNDDHPMAKIAVQLCATLASIIMTPESAHEDIEALRAMLLEISSERTPK